MTSAVFFKTTDGGKTWTKVFYLNERTGVIDLVLDRRHPNTLYAAAFTNASAFPGIWRTADQASGIYKTTDSGRTWHRLEGGLPRGNLGRIGLALFQKNPKVLYALIDNRNPRAATGEDDGESPNRTDRAPRLMGGEVYRTGDGGLTWTMMSSDRDDLSRKTGCLQPNPRGSGKARAPFHYGRNALQFARQREDVDGVQPNRARPGPFNKAFGDFRTCG